MCERTHTYINTSIFARVSMLIHTYSYTQAYSHTQAYSNYRVKYNQSNRKYRVNNHPWLTGKCSNNYGTRRPLVEEVTFTVISHIIKLCSAIFRVDSHREQVQCELHDMLICLYSIIFICFCFSKYFSYYNYPFFQINMMCTI